MHSRSVFFGWATLVVAGASASPQCADNSFSKGPSVALSFTVLHCHASLSYAWMALDWRRYLACTAPSAARAAAGARATCCGRCVLHGNGVLLVFGVHKAPAVHVLQLGV